MNVIAPEQAPAQLKPAAEIRVAVKKKFQEQQRAVGELQKNGINLKIQAGKKPSEIIAKLPGWQDNEMTQGYVAGAMILYTEVQRKASALLEQANNTGNPITAEAAQAQAEASVLSARITKEQRAAAILRKKAAGEQPQTTTPPIELTPPSEQPTDESIIAVEVGEAPITPNITAEQAELKKITDATKAWADEGRPLNSARLVLEQVAAQDAVTAIRTNLQKIRVSATDENTDKHARAKYTEEARVLKEAERFLDAQKKKIEITQRDPNASVEDRLLAYDVDLAMSNSSSLDVDLQIVVAKSQVTAAGTEAEKATVQRNLDAAEASKKTIDDKIKILKEEREQIGTPAERQVNYVSGMVLRLTKGLNLSEEQTVEAMKDPLGLLDKLISDPKVGMLGILKNTDIPIQEKDKLMSIASAKAAHKTIKFEDAKDSIKGGGKIGLLAILLLMYTAYGANKKAKGGQMG